MEGDSEDALSSEGILILLLLRFVFSSLLPSLRVAAGLDPQYGSVPDYYPKEVGDLTIPKIAGSLTMNPTKTVSCANKIRKFRLDG